MKRTFWVALGVTLLTGAAEVRGQAPTETEGTAVQVTVAGFSSITFDEGLADDRGIGSRGYGVRLYSGALVRDVFEVGGGFGLEYHTDDESFQQATTGGTRGSMVGALWLDVGVALLSPALRSDDGTSVSVGVVGGRTFITTDRRIANCTDCRDDDLGLGGGPYVGGIVRVLSSTGKGLELRYVRYGGSGAARSGLQIGWKWR